jgi:hypothetical protein
VLKFLLASSLSCAFFSAINTLKVWFRLRDICRVRVKVEKSKGYTRLGLRLGLECYLLPFPVPFQP